MTGENVQLKLYSLCIFYRTECLMTELHCGDCSNCNWFKATNRVLRLSFKWKDEYYLHGLLQRAALQLIQLSSQNEGRAEHDGCETHQNFRDNKGGYFEAKGISQEHMLLI